MVKCKCSRDLSWKLIRLSEIIFFEKSLGAAQRILLHFVMCLFWYCETIRSPESVWLIGTPLPANQRGSRLAALPHGLHSRWSHWCSKKKKKKSHNALDAVVVFRLRSGRVENMRFMISSLTQSNRTLPFKMLPLIVSGGSSQKAVHWFG